MDTIIEAVGNLLEMASEASESIIQTMLDGASAWLFDAVYSFLTFLLESFTEQFSPNISRFVDYFSEGASAELNGMISWAGVDISAGSSTPDIIKFFGYFAALGFALSSVIFIISIISAANPLTDSKDKDTPLQLIIRFGAVFLLINFSPLVLREAFDLTQRAWDLITSITGNMNYAEMGMSIASMGTLFMGVMSGGATLIIVLIIFLVVIVHFIKFLVEIIERYMVVGFLYMCFPTACAAGVSKNTERILKSYAQMLFSHLFLLLLNELFIYLFVKMTSTMQLSLVGLFSELAFLRFATKIDSYLHTLGLTTAQTGGNMGTEIMMGGMLMARAAKGAIGKGANLASAFGGGGIGEDDLLSKTGIAVGQNWQATSENPNNTGATVSQKANATVDVGRGGTLQSAPIAEMTKDTSMASDFANGDTKTIGYLSPGAQGAVLSQVMGGMGDEGEDTAQNNFGRALGMDSARGDYISDMRPEKNGGMSFKANYMTGLDSNGNPVYDSIPMHASKGRENNYVASAKDIEGNTWNIGNNASAGKEGSQKGFGRQALGNEKNSSLGDIAARTGMNGQKLEKMSNGRISADELTAARYNKDKDTLELFGPNGQKIGDVRTDSNGNETLIENPGYSLGGNGADNSTFSETAGGSNTASATGDVSKVPVGGSSPSEGDEFSQRVRQFHQKHKGNEGTQVLTADTSSGATQGQSDAYASGTGTAVPLSGSGTSYEGNTQQEMSAEGNAAYGNEQPAGSDGYNSTFQGDSSGSGNGELVLQGDGGTEAFESTTPEPTAVDEDTINAYANSRSFGAVGYDDYDDGAYDYDDSSSSVYDPGLGADSDAIAKEDYGHMSDNSERAYAMLDNLRSGNYGDIAEFTGQVPDEVVELGNTLCDDSSPESGKYTSGFFEVKSNGRTIAYGMRMETEANTFKVNSNKETVYKNDKTCHSIRVWKDRKNPLYTPKARNTNPKLRK